MQEIRATAKDGYVFDKWNDDNTDNFNIGSKLKLTDIQGRVLIIESIKGNGTKLDVSLLSKGVYFVQLNNIVQKLIIE